MDTSLEDELLLRTLEKRKSLYRHKNPSINISERKVRREFLSWSYIVMQVGFWRYKIKLPQQKLYETNEDKLEKHMVNLVVCAY